MTYSTYDHLHWTRVAPYGHWAHQDKVQVFGYTQAQALCKTFESGIQPALPVYVGHPDDPELSKQQAHQDRHVYGEILALEARADGLWGQVGWKPEGWELVRTGTYKALSVRWTLEPAQHTQHLLHPYKIHSLGLTNQPNLPKTTLTVMEKEIIVLSEKLQKLLELPASCDAQSLEAALEVQIESASQASQEAESFFKLAQDRQQAFEDLQKEKSAQKKHLEALMTERIQDKVNLATAEGRIPMHEAQLWKERLEKDYASTLRQLNDIKPAFATHQVKTQKGLPRVEAALERSDLIRRVQERSKRTGERLSLAWSRLQKRRAQGF